MSNFDLSYIFKAIDRFSPSVNKMAEANKKFEDSFSKISDKLDTANKKLERFSEKAKKYILLPMLAIGSYALKNAEQFDDMNFKLQAITGNASDFEKLKKVIDDLSLSFGMKREQVIDATGSLLSAGYSADEVSAKLKQLKVFSIATGESVDNLSSIFTRMKVTGELSSRALIMMSRSGVPLMKEFQKYYNLSDKQMEKIKGHSLGLKLIEPVLTMMTEKGSSFFNVFEEKSRSVGTSIERSHLIIRQMSASLGVGIKHAFNLDENFAKLVDTMERGAIWFNKFMGTEQAMQLIRIIGIIGGVVASMVALTSALKIAGFVLRGIAGIFTVVNAQASVLLMTVYALAKAILAIKGLDFSAIGSELKQFGQMVVSGQGGKALSMLRGGMVAANDETSITGAIGDMLAPKTNLNVDIATPRSTTLQLPSGERIGNISYDAKLGQNTLYAGG